MQLEGKNALLEALKAERTLDKVFIAKGADDRLLRHIAAEARKKGAVVSEADRRKLDAMSQTKAHQGVIAFVTELAYATTADILNVAKERGESPLIVVCDEISDPHNLGAIIRSAETAGAHGVIIPKRRSAGMSNSIVEKASAGAVSHIAVARVPNITAALKELQLAGVWIAGAAAPTANGELRTENGEFGNTGNSPLSTLHSQFDWTRPIALVIGSEGKGIGRLVRETCDFFVSIPMRGKITSLNASAAAAVLLYEAVRQRFANAELRMPNAELP